MREQQRGSLVTAFSGYVNQWAKSATVNRRDSFSSGMPRTHFLRLRDRTPRGSQLSNRSPQRASDISGVRDWVDAFKRPDNQRRRFPSSVFPHGLGRYLRVTRARSLRSTKCRRMRSSRSSNTRSRARTTSAGETRAGPNSDGDDPPPPPPASGSGSEVPS